MKEPLFIMAFNASVIVFMGAHEGYMHLRKLWTPDLWTTPAQLAQWSCCLIVSGAALWAMVRKL